MKIPTSTKTIDVLPDDSAGTVAADMIMAKQVADTLMEVYPGYMWLVRADHRNGVCLIRCGQISAQLQTQLVPSMVMHLRNMTDPSIVRKTVIKMGGELLERASLTRGKWDGTKCKRLDGLAERYQPKR
jgi:hypothetical protein